MHHINHDKFDNRIENLEVMTASAHNHKHGLERGKKWAKLRCPVCGRIFELEYHNTVYQKYPNDTTKAQCCGRSCGGKLARMKQLGILTNEMKTAISENLLSVYVKFAEDNSEVTLD